jgi:hypothetical protein
MAEPPLLLPEDLQLQILQFVDTASSPMLAFGALIGAAVGACDKHLETRAMAEALWVFGDQTVAKLVRA